MKTTPTKYPQYDNVASTPTSLAWKSTTDTEKRASPPVRRAKKKSLAQEGQKKRHISEHGFTPFNPYFVGATAAGGSSYTKNEYNLSSSKIRCWIFLKWNFLRLFWWWVKWKRNACPHHQNTVKNWNERFLVAQCKRKQSYTLEWDKR